MPPDSPLFIGIDISGGRKPFTYAAVAQTGRLVALKEGTAAEDVLAFLSGQPGVTIAINAPSRPSAGSTQESMQSMQSMRLVERQLRERGLRIATTASSEEACAVPARTGFDFYRRLESLGVAPYPTAGAPRQWLETHPHAVFSVLLGQVPLPRSSLEGRQQRQLALYEYGLGIRDPMEFFEELTRHKLLKGTLPLEHVHTPKELDALAAACMAYVTGRYPARVGKLGDPQEGQIFLPAAELKVKY